MKATIVTTGLCALFLSACSAEQVTPAAPPAGNAADGNAMTSAQAALVLDKVP